MSATFIVQTAVPENGAASDDGCFVICATCGAEIYLVLPPETVKALVEALSSSHLCEFTS